MDDDGLATSTNCDAPNDADSSTIQGAVDLATAGDTVKVCPGDYPETVRVEKTLVLRGAKAGVDARTRSPTLESEVKGVGGSFYVDADNVVIDGFTIRDATEVDGVGAGAFLSPGFSGYMFANNIVRNNATGIGLYLNSSGDQHSDVFQNLFSNNNESPGGDGNGIYSDRGLFDVLIDSNKFTGHNSTSIYLAGGRFTSTTSQADVTISDNLLVDDNSITLFNTRFSALIGNEFRDSRGSAMYIGGGVVGLDVLSNDFIGGDGRGIRIPLDCIPGVGCFGEPSTNSDILVRFNKFENNAGRGIDLADDRYTGILDARRNWWGHNWGPSEWGIGGGDGVSAHVNYYPWSLNRAFSKFSGCSKAFNNRDNIITGTAGNDILCGGGGDDILKGIYGADLLIGGAGDDLLKGGTGNDAAIGQGGDDLLQGAAGFDSLQGWDGADVCAVGPDGGRTATCEN